MTSTNPLLVASTATSLGSDRCCKICCKMRLSLLTQEQLPLMLGCKFKIKEKALFVFLCTTPASAYLLRIRKSCSSYLSNWTDRQPVNTVEQAWAWHFPRNWLN